jgi:hypothetical protein
MIKKNKNAAEQRIAPHLLTPHQAADYIQVTPRTIRNLAARGILPQIRITSKIVRYRRPDLEQVLAGLSTGTPK